MDGGILGGGILFVVLALLWLAILVPSWAKNREYRAAEQNAARLQRTIRLLAEASDLPEEHVVEANAKEALKHEKMLKAQRSHEESARKAELKKLRNEQRMEATLTQQELAQQKRALRAAKLSSPVLKPVRITAALAAVLGLVGLLVGVGLAIGGLGFATLIISLVAAVTGVGTLVVLAPGKQPVQQPAAAPQTVTKVERPELPEVRSETPAEPSAEELQRKQREHEAAQARAAEQRERARAMAKARQVKPQAVHENQTDSILLREKRETREHSATPPAAPATPPTPRVELDTAAKSRRLQAQERLRSMGVVGDTSEGMPNLDEALKRRRNAS